MTSALAILEKATKGLLWPSETDAPFEVFSGEPPALSAEAYRTLTLGEFLQGELPELRKILEATLTDIVVYRFGTVDAEYFIVGKDASGRFAGVKTRATET